MKLKISQFVNKYINNSERNRKLLLGSGAMAISTFVGTLTRVGLISLLARIYTKDQFGIWVAITSAAAVMVTSDFGIGNALRNKLAVLRVSGRSGDAEGMNYFFSVLYFFFMLTIVISILLLIFRNQIPYETIFKTNNLILKNQGVIILIVVEIIFLIGIPLGIGATMFFAYQETNLVAFFTIIGNIATALVVGLLAWMGKSIVATSIVFFLINIIVNTIATIYFIYRRKWNPLKFNIKYMFSHVWSLLALSFTFAILQISGTFIYNSVTLVATAKISLGAAAQLNLVQKLYTVIITIFLSFYNPLWAGYADAINKNEWHWVKKTLTKTIQITIGLFAVFILIFLFYGNFILRLFAGKGYVTETQLFLSMGLWALLYSLYSMGVAFLSALGKIKLITVVTGLFALSFIYFATLFGSRSGIYGISYVSVVMYFLLALATYLQAYQITNQSLKIKS